MENSGYFVQDNSDIEDQKLEAAKKLYQSGNYQGALKLYLDMLNASYSYKLYYEIGRCYYKLNDVDNAILFFKRSIDLESYKNPSYIFLGTIYHKLQEIENAIENWMIAHTHRPDDENICLNLATTYFSKDMRFESFLFYEKYLKYAKDKTSAHYLEIRKSIEEFSKIGNEFYQKANIALNAKDNETAIQCLEYAARNLPNNFDINLRLGKLCYEKKDYMKALVYLKQAFCLDKRSLDTLELLSSTLINIGDFTGGYCCLKRIMPLVINNQKEYLGIIQTIKQLESSFDNLSYQGHADWAEKYYSQNNYYYALFEYENCTIINSSTLDKFDSVIQNLRLYINPEERIIKTCFEKGATLFSAGNYKLSNKYFSKIMSLTAENSYEYKLAKSRVVNV